MVKVHWPPMIKFLWKLLWVPWYMVCLVVFLQRSVHLKFFLSYIYQRYSLDIWWFLTRFDSDQNLLKLPMSGSSTCAIKSVVQSVQSLLFYLYCLNFAKNIDEDSFITDQHFIKMNTRKVWSQKILLLHIEKLFNILNYVMLRNKQ